MGRPSIYSEELVDRIMAEVIAGHSIHQICKRPEFPAESTFFAWLLEHEELAREARADNLAREILEIADDCEGDLVPVTRRPISAATAPRCRERSSE
jgi:hypothetical protein